MSESEKKKDPYLGNLPSNYILPFENKLVAPSVQALQIEEDADGNCTVNGVKTEKNACSMLKK